MRLGREAPWGSGTILWVCHCVRARVTVGVSAVFLEPEMVRDGAGGKPEEGRSWEELVRWKGRQKNLLWLLDFTQGCPGWLWRMAQM